jgi:hypothetical protein
MARRVSLGSAIILALLVSALAGCKLKQKPKPVVLRVLSNLASPYGHELDHRILEFQTSNRYTRSGRPITVELLDFGEYRDLLEKHIGRDTTVDVIILDSPEDAALNAQIQAEMPNAVNICAAVRACPAEVPVVIPKSTQGERREAAQVFQDALKQKPPG